MQIGSTLRCVSIRITSSRASRPCCELVPDTPGLFHSTSSLWLLHRIYQKASEQRMANLVSQQVVAALAGGSGAGVPGISPTPSPFARSPGRKDKGADWSNSKQLVSSIIPPRRLPAIDGDSSTRVDALEEKVDKLTIEIGGIKTLLEDLASRSLQP